MSPETSSPLNLGQLARLGAALSAYVAFWESPNTLADSDNAWRALQRAHALCDSRARAALWAILGDRADAAVSRRELEPAKAPARYVKVDDEPAGDTASVIIEWSDGECEDVISYSGRDRRRNAERQAAGLARNQGCEWGCNY